MKKLFRKFLKFVLREALDLLDEVVSEIKEKAREKALEEIEKINTD